MENNTNSNEQNQPHEENQISEDKFQTFDSSKEKNNQRKFNGFLRNNNHKKQNKKPTPDMHLKQNKNPHPQKNQSKEENSDVIVIKIFEPKQTQEEYEVFNFLRLRTGHNEKKFWENLDLILKQKEFSEIKKSNLSLVGYSCLHDSTIVFDKLLEKFGNQLTQEEFDNSILKFGIHKNPEIMKSSLKFYSEHFNVEESFLKRFIVDIAKVSYRQETNHILLKWLAPKLNEELLEIFWTQAISNHNIPIIIQSLEYLEYSSYLNQNIKSFEISLESMGRLFEIKKLLQETKTFRKVDNLKEPVIINEGLKNNEIFDTNIWLSDKSEQFKVIQENLSEKKPTEVIIKKKRKIA